MTLKIILSKESLTSFLQNDVQFDTKQNFDYLVKKCSSNDNIFCLNVSSDNGPDIEYAMAKILNNDRKKLNYVKNLKNVFTIQDESKSMYLVMEKKNLRLPRRNNLENLTIILKSLAEFQARNVLNIKQGPSEPENSEYKVNNISDTVTSLEYFKAFDKRTISDLVLNIQKSVDELFKSSPLVKSSVSISANNIILTDSDKCVFLDLNNEVLKPPVYDALVLMFALSDNNFRQKHLKELLNIYYQTFIDFVRKSDQTVAENFDINVFENHLKILLPIVKFESAVYLNQKDKSIEEQKALGELLKNIGYCFKYPQISYEDSLEAISRKLGSTEFELIHYQLVPLDEKNGHMGEYFNLKFEVKHSGKSKKFCLFLKRLNASNAVLNAVTEPASLKEQFFFRTLIPLFKQYSLESLLDFAPNCYFDRLSDVLVQDNVVQLGYKPLAPDTKLGYEALKSAFFKNAKLHACSLLLEDRLSKEKGTTVSVGDAYEKYFHDWIFESVDGGVTKLPVHPDNSKPGVHELIDSFEDISRDVSLEHFHSRVDDIFKVFVQKLNYPAKQFRNVICHGDLYAGNMLIKYDQNDIAENCFLIDYQCLRYAPIASDLLVLAYFNTRKEVRDKYLERLLEEYYDELKKIMSQFGEDVNKFYTRQEFRECVNYMKPVALIAAISYAQVIGLPQEKREEVFFDEERFNYYLLENRKEYIKYLLTFDEDYVSYLKGLVIDLFDVCVVDS